MLRTPLLALCCAAIAAAEPAALVTAFGPFAGRGVNGSAAVARSLDGALIAGHRVHVLVMPVRWGEPQRAIPPLLAALRPALALGLGEGHPDRIACERVADNLARAIPDADGAGPPAPVLDPQAPPRRPATLEFSPEWFSDLRLPVPVGESRDAGGYLCNAALWTLAGAADLRGGFLHLPPQGRVADADYVGRFRPVVVRLIERNLAPPRQDARDAP